jgi:hypothetical protein
MEERDNMEAEQVLEIWVAQEQEEREHIKTDKTQTQDLAPVLVVVLAGVRRELVLYIAVVVVVDF